MDQDLGKAGGLTLDFTSVGPDSGGVGVVAAGVARGLIEIGTKFSAAVDAAQFDRWVQRAPDLAANLQPVSVSLSANSGWQTRLRRVVPRSALAQRAVGTVRSLRARSIAGALTDDVVWLPFHRVPLATDRGVVTIHDLRVFEPGLLSPMDQRVIEVNVRKACAVVCSWAHPFHSVLERFPEAAGKTFISPLPVLNPGNVVPRTGPGERPARLLFPGFITPHKNHEVIVRALPLMGDAIAVFTGSEDGGQGDYLRRLAQSLGVADRIEWLGFVTSEALEDEYARADLLAMPTRWEAASGPVYEAIARELPFVASEIPPIRSQLDALELDAETFNVDSPDAFATAVSRTLANYDTHVAQIRRVAGPVRDRTWAQTAAEYGRIFDWVAGRAPHPEDLTIG